MVVDFLHEKKLGDLHSNWLDSLDVAVNVAIPTKTSIYHGTVTGVHRQFVMLRLQTRVYHGAQACRSPQHRTDNADR